MHISMNAICQATSFLCQLILFDLCQFQNHLCPIRITYLPPVCPLWLKFCTTNLLLLFNNSQTSSEFQILIYTLDPWPLTEPDRFQSTTTHVSMPWLQVLSNTKSVILGSQSTIKSIIVPSTNMGYLCSLKNPKLLYILRHSSVTWSYSKLQQSHIRVCKHVFIADSLIQNFHTLTVCKHVFIAGSIIQNFHTFNGLQACLHCR